MPHCYVIRTLSVLLILPTLLSRYLSTSFDILSYTLLAKHIFITHSKDEISSIVYILPLCMFLIGFFAVT